MLRRLFFVIPDPRLAVEVVNEIEHMGVARDHIHALARDGMDVSALPKATAAQRNDVAWKIEWNLWKVNLALFGVALLGFILALSAASATWSVVAMAAMLLTFLLGALKEHMERSECDDPRVAVGAGGFVGVRTRVRA